MRTHHSLAHSDPLNAENHLERQRLGRRRLLSLILLLLLLVLAGLIEVDVLQFDHFETHFRPLCHLAR